MQGPRAAHALGSSLGAIASGMLLAALGAQEPIVPPKTNRLADETSPYLRLHRHNPVDWYPWGEAALQRARDEDKPIFLSIGYSACHWCHVMARESFEDPATAAVLNEHFVCIKVDREERPDLDEVYLAALQAMDQPGGWPLSAWLLPDGRPFYGGTYFPPEDAHGRPGFRRLCEHLAKAFRERRAEIDRGAGELAQHLQQALAPELQPGDVGDDLLDGVLADAARRFDAEHGGFGEPPHFAPKFPPARQLQALLRQGGDRARTMVRTSLDEMHDGGMFDQLGGGFHRYSTDRAWIVPHFEKMLYDNALLVPLYLEAAVAFGERRYAATARATLDWMLREMRHDDGGFFASQDAQSEGVEGRFFVWTREQFDALLGDDAELAARHFGVTADGNWERQNVLVHAASAAALAETFERPLPEVEAALARARANLFAARDRRVRPATDDKILCAWNGLALSALSHGYRALGDARYLAAAQAAAAFALRELVVDGRCRRSWHSGSAPLPGYLDDHAQLAEGLLALFEIDGDPRWLEAARALLQAVAAHFEGGDGTYWYTAADQPAVVARTKSAIEGATPSGTAAVANAALRAGLLLADTGLYDRGVAVLRAHRELLSRAPTAVPSLVLALQFHLGAPREVVVVGAPDDPRTAALRQRAFALPPGTTVVAPVHDGTRERLETLSELFVGKVEVAGAPAAYVCRRGTCERPVTDPARLGDGL